MTGLSRQHVLRAIKKLLPKMVIGVTKNGNSSINVYEFNKDFEQWRVLPKKATVTNNGNRVLPKMGTKVLPKMVHTKEKKETIQKKVVNTLSDEEWLTQLSNNPAYEEINIKIEHAKMLAWCEVNQKPPSRRRFINWLNRVEKPLKTKDFDYTKIVRERMERQNGKP